MKLKFSNSSTVPKAKFMYCIPSIASEIKTVCGILTLLFPCIVNIITIDNRQDATILIYLIIISSTCFGRCFRPSSGAYHCKYSFWYCPPMLLLAGVAYLVELTQHQPAATSVDNTRSCSDSDMLLMMGENIARNM